MGDLGFSDLWPADTARQARDIFGYLTLATVNTSRVGLGPCILLVDHFSLSGTIDDCLRKIQQMADLGANHVTLVPAAEDNRMLLETTGPEILPPFAS